jgi:hypothetical protein
MKRKTLTSSADPVKGQPTANSPTTVIAGKPKSPSARMLRRLKRCAEERHRVLVQMKNDSGYCGWINAFNDGWLSMQDTTTIGSKNTITLLELIVYVIDGRKNAHTHNIKSTDIGATK